MDHRTTVPNAPGAPGSAGLPTAGSDAGVAGAHPPGRGPLGGARGGGAAVGVVFRCGAGLPPAAGGAGGLSWRAGRRAAPVAAVYAGGDGPAVGGGRPAVRAPGRLLHLRAVRAVRAGAAPGLVRDL